MSFVCIAYFVVLYIDAFQQKKMGAQDAWEFVTTGYEEPSATQIYLVLLILNRSNLSY